MTEPLRYLLDVNTLIALLDEDHIHYEFAKRWFGSSGHDFFICPFVEAGLLRHLVRPQTGGLSVSEAAQTLSRLRQWPGYHYQPVTAGWENLTAPFFHRIFGHKQITDAYLLGLAVREEWCWSRSIEESCTWLESMASMCCCLKLDDRGDWNKRWR